MNKNIHNSYNVDEDKNLTKKKLKKKEANKKYYDKFKNVRNVVNEIKNNEKQQKANEKQQKAEEKEKNKILLQLIKKLDNDKILKILEITDNINNIQVNNNIKKLDNENIDIKEYDDIINECNKYFDSSEFKEKTIENLVVSISQYINQYRILINNNKNINNPLINILIENYENKYVKYLLGKYNDNDKDDLINLYKQLYKTNLLQKD